MIHDFLKKVGRPLVCAGALLALDNAVQGQQPQTTPAVEAAPSPSPAPANSDAELRARIERLEQQNQELLHAVQTLQAPRLDPTVVTAGNDQAEKKAAGDSDAKNQAGDGKDAKQPDEWYRIGSNLAVTASFKDGLFLWLDTPNKDFTMHIGAWMQYDNVFWTQSSALRISPGTRVGPKQGVASGPATGGIGDLEDGTYFRRIRPFAEGTAWDTVEYRLIPALENNQFTTVGLDEFWVGMKDIPFLDTVRVGHIKNQFGIEGDTTASSRAMTFMERSAYSDAIELNQNFVTGILFLHDFFNQHSVWTTVIFRPDQGASSGAFFGDGQYGIQSRLTALPLWEEEGRHMLHLAVSGGWRDGTNNLATSPLRTVQLRARPELRDDTPDASPAGAQVVPNANSNRLIDTGPIAESDDFLLGTELLYIRGPFSVQAEYGFHWVDGAVGIAPTGLTLNPPLIPAQDYMFHGGYIQVAYTLTGENRAYDRRMGTLAREYYGTAGPYTKAWFVRDENGCLNWGIGAWEIAARYSYVNLNEGTGPNRIQGGVLNGVSLALNWYLNNNLNVMFDWVYDQRSLVPPGVIAGYTSGFGAEVQFQF